MKLSDIPQSASFGTAYSYDVEGNADELHVFALSVTGEPQLHVFADDEDGRDSIATLVRAGLVVSIVRGRKVRFTVESVVTLSGTSASQHSSLVASSELSSGQG
jgi:hypothetical protein